MYATAREAHPDWVIQWLEAPEGAWYAAEAVGHIPLGKRRRICINPHSLEVQGEGSWVNAQRILRDSISSTVSSTRCGSARCWSRSKG